VFGKRIKIYHCLKLKCLVIDGNLKVVYEHSVRFDDLRHYETKDGCHIHEDGVTVTSPTIMWIEVTQHTQDPVYVQLCYLWPFHYDIRTIMSICPKLMHPVP